MTKQQCTVCLQHKPTTTQHFSIYHKADNNDKWICLECFQERAERKREKRKKLDIHRLVREAIRKGRLTRPTSCSQCGKICKPDGHHHNGYDDAHIYDVIWLCRPCHIEADMIQKRALGKTISGICFFCHKPYRIPTIVNHKRKYCSQHCALQANRQRTAVWKQKWSREEKAARRREILQSALSMNKI